MIDQSTVTIEPGRLTGFFDMPKKKDKSLKLFVLEGTNSSGKVTPASTNIMLVILAESKQEALRIANTTTGYSTYESKSIVERPLTPGIVSQFVKGW